MADDIETPQESDDAAEESDRPNFTLPDDFKSEAEFLEYMRKQFDADLNFDRTNREAAQEDLKFMVSDQWDLAAKARREAANKPCLTINRLPAFVAQIVGNRRMNETTINVIPERGGDKAIAEIREGLIRSIQKDGAELAYDKALENQVICGIGNFHIRLDYESDDVFDQCIKIEQIPDALAVVWDRRAIEPTGEDANHAFVVEVIGRKDFEAQWPWAAPTDVSQDNTIHSELTTGGWMSDDSIRIATFWRMRSRKRAIALMRDDTVVDITGLAPDDPIHAQIVIDPKTTKPVTRTVNRKYAQMYLCSGQNILEGPYELPISRVPVFRVTGWEIFIGESRQRWGLIRFLKDPQRLHNYWRSVVAEKLTGAPRAKWVATKEAVEGYEKDWQEAHLSDNPLLIYNGTAGQPPVRVQPAEVEAALLQQSEMSSQDIKDVSNIHEANLGMPSNEVSGAAIQARQRVSDTGTIIYHDNLNKAIMACGRVINDLIPVVYDTARTITVLGEDGKADLQAIGPQGMDGAVDLSTGKYKVAITTGPSYATKRMEAATSMTAFINAAPQVAGITLDLIAESMDWPGAKEFARRIRMTLPPGIVNPKDMSPEEQQAAAGRAQAAQQQAAVQQAAATADIQKTQAQTAEAAARAANYNASAQTQIPKVAADIATQHSQMQDRDLRAHLETIRVAGGK